MNGFPCVVPGCTEHLNGPSLSECHALTGAVIAPGNSEPTLMSALAQVCDEDTVTIEVWAGGENGDCVFEDPDDAHEFASRLRAFADQLDRDADLLARLRMREGAGV